MNCLIEHLTLLFKSGLSFSAISAAKSAIVTIQSLCGQVRSEADQALLARYVKGVFNARPQVPRSTST